MFKKPSYTVVRAYRETIEIFDREAKKLETISQVRPLTPEEYNLLKSIRHSEAELTVDALMYINNNVNFRKSFWKKIAKKMK